MQLATKYFNANLALTNLSMFGVFQIPFASILRNRAIALYAAIIIKVFRA
jgi:hypothetical protein